MTAVCWKDDIVILQHPTVRSASEVSLLHCSTNPTQVREFTKQVHTLAWIPQTPCIQSGKNLNKKKNNNNNVIPIAINGDLPT